MLAGRAVAQRLGESAGAALKVGENAVAALGPKLRQFAGEEGVEVHELSPAICGPFAQYGAALPLECNSVSRY
jgi:hypothetical protein